MTSRVLGHHEYWPSWALYAPVVADYFRHALRLGTLRYPFVVNPGIPFGGVVGESKHAIFARLPAHAYPPTVLVEPREPRPEAPAPFPLVAKPDQGERGLGVRFLASDGEWDAYHRRAPRPYLVQAFVSLPFEAGVLFRREGGKVAISSIAVKCRAEVVGDGRSSLAELRDRDPRYRRQRERLLAMRPDVDWSRVPAAGETVVLDEIRNHRRGSRFVDGRSLSGPALAAAMDALVPASSGIEYGRVDLRCPSAEHLRRGEGLVILEVNGITGEPAEIYDPSMSLREALGILRAHWDGVARLGERGLAEGRRPPTWTALARAFREWRTRAEFFDR